jgi:uncharacterized protein (UPF0335 family)
MSDAGASHNGQLQSIVERVERLHEERKAIAGDISELYTEAKGNGYDVKAIKHIVALRSKDANAVREFEEIVDCYKSALGML